MLTTNKLRNYLFTTCQDENGSLKNHLNVLAQQLNANIILANKFGGIIYDINNTLILAVEDKNYETVPIFYKGKAWGTLIIIKTKFTPLERILMEMEASIISTYLH